MDPTASSSSPHAEPPTLLLMVPAMGVAAAFYEPFAARLRAAGIAVRLLDMPGQGSSPLSARRGDDYGYREIVEELLPDAVRAARRELPQGRILLAGHSLGGQLAVLASAELSPALDGLVLVAAGTAHWRSWPAGRRLQACCAVHAIATLAALLPWYPGDRVGFGGAQSRRFMRDWRHNARTGQYRLEGSARGAEALRSALREVRLPVLALSIRNDPIAPEGALLELLAHLPAARVRRVTVSGLLAHAPWKRHFSWARQSAGVEDALLAWLAEDPRSHHFLSGVTDDHARDPDVRDPAPLPAP
ncbi:alpha/beta fold hydrolase [Ramlibacter monticola]|uniref:Alpha/beta fold hydrolase n=1 Tax=Ramlibacter monticola TaxID=1926872 RepID=A0A936YUS1_9BURK|nr:alpha/beta fold hydrolase [Ramlibacter monticola]MBL0390219.1 alpha/beta fold hydrolase [Ramlibacter monticola]